MYICDRLGIDDPLLWFNATDPKVVDIWIAYHQKRQADSEPDSATKAFSKLAKQNAAL